MRAIWAGKLLVVYLAATGVLLLVGHDRVTALDIVIHFAVLAFIAATAVRTALPLTLRLWAPLLVLLFLYAEIPRLIQAAGHTGLYDDVVMRWELALFQTQPALRWAALAPWQLLSELLHASYLSYYAIIVAVPLVLHLSGRWADFDEAMLVLMLTFTICFAWYVAFPVAGPRYLWPPPSPAQASPGPFRAAAVWLLEARSSRGTAFPSSHVAVSVTQSLLAIRYFGIRGLPIVIATVGLAFGAIYGGFHYAIDVVAGLVVGSVVYVAGLQMTTMLRARYQANASAPT